MVVYQSGVCDEIESWLGVVEDAALRLKIISGPLVVTRGIYCQDGTSGDTHCPGAAADLAANNIRDADRLVWLIRNAGGAGFERDAIPGTWPWHIHLVLNGDSALTNGKRHDTGGAYQVSALNAGFNGLGAGGRGGHDTGPRDDILWPLRTWQQGIAWLNKLEDDVSAEDVWKHKITNSKGTTDKADDRQVSAEWAFEQDLTLGYQARKKLNRQAKKLDRQAKELAEIRALVVAIKQKVDSLS